MTSLVSACMTHTTNKRQVSNTLVLLGTNHLPTSDIIILVAQYSAMQNVPNGPKIKPLCF